MGKTQVAKVDSHLSDGHENLPVTLLETQEVLEAHEENAVDEDDSGNPKKKTKKSKPEKKAKKEKKPTKLLEGEMEEEMEEEMEDEVEDKENDVDSGNPKK